MRGPALLWFCSLCLSLGACLLKAEGFAGGGPDAGTGSPADAASQDSATEPVVEAGVDADTDAGSPNLLLNGDFELGCAGWKPGPQITLSESLDVHTGAKACRLCMNAPTDTYIYQDVPRNTSAGERMLAEIWIRGVDGLPTQNLSFFGTFSSNNQDHEGPKASLYAGTKTWHRASTILEPFDDTPLVSLVVVLDGNQGKCAILDDAVLRLLP